MTLHTQQTFVSLPDSFEHLPDIYKIKRYFIQSILQWKIHQYQFFLESLKNEDVESARVK